MRVIVTGGDGFIGQHLMAILKAEGVEACCWDLSQGHDALAPEELTDVAKGCDALVHLVGLPDISTCQEMPDFSFYRNVLSTHVALEACRRGGCPRLVFASSAAVYGAPEDLPVKENAPIRPITTYGHHKALAEAEVRHYQEHYGVEYTILRLFNVYGPGGQGVMRRFLSDARKGKTIQAYGLTQYRDFVHVSDVARAFYQAATSDHARNKTLNIGSGCGMQIRELLTIVKEIVLEAKWQELPVERLYDLIADIRMAVLLLGFDPAFGRTRVRTSMQEELSTTP